jgi:arginyl-tRNA synthetase
LAKAELFAKGDWKLSPNESEKDLIMLLSEFKDVKQSCGISSPALVANYVYELVKL